MILVVMSHLSLVPFGLLGFLFLMGFIMPGSPKTHTPSKTSPVGSGTRQTHTQCRTALDARRIAQRANQSVLDTSLEHIHWAASHGQFECTIKHAPSFVIEALRRRKFTVSTDGDGLAIVSWKQ